MKGLSSSTPFEGGQMGLGAGGEGVSFTFLLGREKVGGGKLLRQHRDDGSKKARSKMSIVTLLGR